jgi:hypothetical protein
MHTTDIKTHFERHHNPLFLLFFPFSMQARMSLKCERLMNGM